MSTSDQAADELVNKGFIVTRPNLPGPEGGRTLIVTGLRRSGTSLVAVILREVGIFMGSAINDSVHEDEEVARLLVARDTGGLQQLIRERATNYGTWGFKLPMLCEFLGPDALAMFGNPYVIVIFRDPIAIAVRNALSEYREQAGELRVAVDEQAAMVTFIEHLNCPTLLLSYEKSLLFPHEFIDVVTQFCGLPSSVPLRERLIRLIEPNRQAYIVQARRRYDGIIDGVTDGYLRGWCRLTAADDPVELELFLDDRPVMQFSAGEFRQDLLDAGFGTGNHGFRLHVQELGLMSDTVIRIRVAKFGIELENSGRCLRELSGPRME